MKYSLSPYELKVRQSDVVKKGYLLRVEGPSGAFGYSDLFPWPEFGDPECAEIPKLLAKKTSGYALIERALERAELDLKARDGGVDLTAKLKFQNHFLLSSTRSLNDIEKALEQGFVKFKLKCGRDLSRELEFLEQIKQSFEKDVLLRLDFNGRLKKEEESLFWPYLEMLDFVEDPYRDSKEWRNSKFPLAFDHPGFESSKVNYQWLIIKPAKQNPPKGEKNLIFTSYLGHPVGMAHDSYQASLAGEPVAEYGLMSDGFYEPTVFSEALIKKGPELGFVGGLGIGFDKLLEEQEWKPL